MSLGWGWRPVRINWDWEGKGGLGHYGGGRNGEKQMDLEWLRGTSEWTGGLVGCRGWSGGDRGPEVMPEFPAGDPVDEEPWLSQAWGWRSRAPFALCLGGLWEVPGDAGFGLQMRTLNCQRNVDVVNIERVIAAMGGNRGPRVDIGGSGDFQHGKACRWSSAGSSLRAAGRPVVMSRKGASPTQSPGAPNVMLAWSGILEYGGWTSLSFLSKSAWTRDGKIIQAHKMQACSSFLTRIHLSAKLQVSLEFGKAGSHTAFFWDKGVLITLTTTLPSEEDEWIKWEFKTQEPKWSPDEEDPGGIPTPGISLFKSLIFDVVSLFKVLMAWRVTAIWGDTLQGDGASSWVFHIWVNAWVTKGA